MTITQIQHYAESLVEQYNPEGLTPFPFERIQADRPNLEIYFANTIENDLSGMITYDKTSDKFFIFINTERPQTRQNFTIAHELGHYFLHAENIKSDEVFVDGDQLLDGSFMLFRQDNPVDSHLEVEANNFAAALLMPKDLVMQVWESLKDITECAKVFNVSTLAMTIRLERLGLVS